MRLIYFLLKIPLNYALRIFYPRMKFVNAPKKFFGRTIYVSNHSAAFMDPIAIASLTRPIVFFMTRSDVFTTFTKPFLWLAHMIPIYRQHDGEDTKAKNDEVFQICSSVLKNGRNLLIFGEGFTDDKFIRRLKPVKKGAVRIGFQALENINWNKKIYISAIGVNYSDPSKMRSDVLFSYSDKICLNEYQQAYIENPNKAVTDVTKLIERLMQEQITYVEDKNLLDFHEEVMMITRKGMHPESTDLSIPLEKRWSYSRNLALHLNERSEVALASLNELKEKLHKYTKTLDKLNILDRHVYWRMTSGNRIKEVFAMFFLLPFALIGIVHCALPYLIVKRFAEKTFKRRVFWASVKVFLGMTAIGLLNIPAIFLFYHFIFPSWWLAIAYYSTIGLTGLAAYVFFENFKEYKAKGRATKLNLTELIEERKLIEKEILSRIDVA